MRLSGPHIRINKFLTISILAAAFAFMRVSGVFADDSINNGGNAHDPGIERRRAIFMIERQIAARAVKRSALEEVKQSAEKSAGDISITADKGLEIGSGSVKVGLGAKNTNTGGNGNSAANGKGDGSQSFGSIAVKLGSGSLTSYSYSSTGLDLSSVTPGYGLKVLLKENDPDTGTSGNGSAGANDYSLLKNPAYGIENYEKFKDMLTPEQKAKDYMFTGMGMEMNIGSYKLGLLNYSRPPEKKQVVFFGSGGVGPYPMDATGIMPGSMVVRVNGTQLNEGGGWSADYIKGEITFMTPVGGSDRVVALYDVTGAGGAGKFMGIRLDMGSVADASEHKDNKNDINAKDKNSINTANISSVSNSQTSGLGSGETEKSARKKIRATSLGVSYFSDDVVTYQTASQAATGTINEIDTTRTLFGMDGGVGFSKYSTATFEFAQSSGDKKADLGRYADKKFKIMDSMAADKNPVGPYQLDTDKLPVNTNTEEVRVDGNLLNRETDYILDSRYGYLTFRKKDLNLTALDEIEVIWRYTTDADIAAAQNPISDSAYTMAFKNKFGKINHTYKMNRSGANFIKIGSSAAANQLGSSEQSVSMPVGRHIDIAGSRSDSKDLLDAASNLVMNSGANKYSVNLNGIKKLKANFQGGSDKRGDDRNTHNEKHDESYTLSYEFSKKANVDYSLTTNRGVDSRTDGESRSGGRNSSIKASMKPFKKMSVDLSHAGGRSRALTTVSSSDSLQKSDGMKVKWTPVKSIDINYDGQYDGFANVVDTATGTEVSGATRSANVNKSGRWTVNWRAGKKLTANMMKDVKRTEYAGSHGTTSQAQWDTRYMMSKKMDFQVTTTNMQTISSNSNVNMRTMSYSAHAHPGAASEVGLRYDANRSAMGTAMNGITTSTKTRGDNITFNLSGEPLKKGCKWSFEHTARRNRNAMPPTAGLSDETITLDREKSNKISAAHPFLGKGNITANLTRTDRVGSMAAVEKSFALSLDWPFLKKLKLTGSFRKTSMTDRVNGASSNKSKDLSLKLDGKIEWK